MRRAPLGTGVVAVGPIAVIRPLVTTTVWSGMVRSRSIGRTVTPTKAVDWAASGAAARARTTSDVICIPNTTAVSSPGFLGVSCDHVPRPDPGPRRLPPGLRGEARVAGHIRGRRGGHRLRHRRLHDPLRPGW